MTQKEIGTFDVLEFAAKLNEDSETITNFGQLVSTLQNGAQRSQNVADFMLSGYIDYLNEGVREGYMVNFVLSTERGVEFAPVDGHGPTGFMFKASRRKQKITLSKQA